MCAHPLLKETFKADEMIDLLSTSKTGSSTADDGFESMLTEKCD